MDNNDCPNKCSFKGVCVKGFYPIKIIYQECVIVKKDFGVMIVPFQKEIKDNNVHMNVIIMVIVYLENAIVNLDFKVFIVEIELLSYVQVLISFIYNIYNY
jgi:hypothetical protein